MDELTTDEAACCTPEHDASCCEPADKTDCCGAAGEECGHAEGEQELRETVRQRYAAAAREVRRG
jgi:hypothetical protein